MSANTELQKQDNPVKEFFADQSVMKKFQEIIGAKAQGFITSVLQIVAGSEQLKACLPKTIFNAAATAATMDLPINQNLGFAWIVGYAGKAQFQMGYKGFVQLAMRTGQYLRLNVIEVYENQFKSWNDLTEELEADFTIEGEGKIVGYCGFFKLINGFEKTTFWKTEKVKKHAEKYSKNKRSDSLWITDFESMAKKTVLKNMLSKWGILSIEMQKAITLDQAVINNAEGTDYTYIDNEIPDDAKLKSDLSTKETLNMMDSKKNKQ